MKLTVPQLLISSEDQRADERLYALSSAHPADTLSTRADQKMNILSAGDALRRQAAPALPLNLVEHWSIGSMAVR